MERYDRNNLIVVNATVVTALVDVLGMIGSIIAAARESPALMMGFWLVCLLVSGGYGVLLYLFRMPDAPKP